MNYRLLMVVVILFTGNINGKEDISIQKNHPSTVQHDFIPSVIELIKKPKLTVSCNCSNLVIDENIECRCEGIRDLAEIPQYSNTKNMNKLTITNSDIKLITKDGFSSYREKLQDVSLENLPYLRVIEDGAFANITNLRTIYISHAPQLKFLNGLLAGVTSTKFLTLRIVHTGLHELPNLSYLPPENFMHLLDFDRNKIEKLATNSIKIVAEQVTLNYNDISIVEDLAFNGSQISRLDLMGNLKLSKLEPNAFKGLKSLRKLDLSRTVIENLPVEGLSELEILLLTDTPSLKTIPSIYDLENLQKAELTHPFHCCAFKYPQQHNPERYAKYQEKFKNCHHTFDTGQQFSKKIRRKRRSDYFLHENYSHVHFPPSRKIGQAVSEEDEDEFFDAIPVENVTASCGKLAKRTFQVKCSPEPNALNPCEDIMGFAWLRIAVWFVVILAVVGNLTVIVVVLFSSEGITVSKFLISNLAFADFCMGLYLLLIASMDVHSVGTYFNFAFHWQYGLGCQLAGFLTIFASHLSVFTLTVVTLERWFAITYAIHLTKRIRLGSAIKIMIGGWIYSIILAAMPLFGISNYGSTSICLPMEINRFADKAYLFVIIFVNAIAFGLIVFCYAQIYLSLGHETRRSRINGDMTIAKKMALLIFTDFVTWAPISFFSITALAGYPLIGVTKSKILLVFFYPINSCANPYLYAIMTAQYRKDLFMLLAKCGICKEMAKKYMQVPTCMVNMRPLPAANNHQQFEIIKPTNSQCSHDTFV